MNKKGNEKPKFPCKLNWGQQKSIFRIGGPMLHFFENRGIKSTPKLIKKRQYDPWQ